MKIIFQKAALIMGLNLFVFCAWADDTDIFTGSDATQRSDILQQVRGVDLLDWDKDLNPEELRKQVGDPLHRVPSVVTNVGSDASPDTTVFFRNQ